MEYIFKSEKSLKRLKKLRAFLVSDKWLLLLALITGLIIVLSASDADAKYEIYGTMVMAYVTGFCFLVSREVMGWLMPLMCAYMVAIRCYDSFDEFIQYVYLAFPLAAILLFHLIAYRKPMKAGGSQFKAMLFVSFSIILGGIGYITPEEYFAGASLYHMFAMGFGMVIIYCYFNAQIEKDKASEFVDKLTKLMVTLGILACFMLLCYYVFNYEKIIRLGRIPKIMWRNNLSTILMLALPFAFLRAHSKAYATVLGFLFGAALVLSGSRGGMIFGTIDLVMCVVTFILYDKKRRKAYFAICALGVLGVIILSPKLFPLLKHTVERIFRALDGITTGVDTETRVAHYKRGIGDFLNRPIFGTGLGYMGNYDIFDNVKGSLCWYHCELIQVPASFGLVGVAAFGYQFIKRCKLLLTEKTLLNLTFFLSYFSLELMSQVNPGIFCPIPYLMLVTLYFSLAEKCNGNKSLLSAKNGSIYETVKIK